MGEPALHGSPALHPQDAAPLFRAFQGPGFRLRSIESAQITRCGTYVQLEGLEYLEGAKRLRRAADFIPVSGLGPEFHQVLTRLGRYRDPVR